MIQIIGLKAKDNIFEITKNTGKRSNFNLNYYTKITLLHSSNTLHSISLRTIHMSEAIKLQ